MKKVILSVVVIMAASVFGGETAKLKGYLGGKLDAMIAHRLTSFDIDYLTAPFKDKTETRGWWQTEFWGKWMHAAVPFEEYSHSPELKARIDRSVEAILATQEPSGYIGNYPDKLRCGEGWDVWGMKYTMMGLMHYYDATKSEKTIVACKRLCDYLIGEIGPNGKRGVELWQTGNWSGFASSSVLEPVVWLYKRTKEQKYLDFATYIVKGMTEPPSGPRLVDLALKGISVSERNGHGNVAENNGGYVMKHNRWKAYEMMSCYQGLIEYYEVTGRKELLDAAIATANDIVKTEINLAGGCSCSEAWYKGSSRQYIAHHKMQETCVLTTWMRFCEKLFTVTGDAKWADELERTFYNAYLASMKPDGSDFAMYTPLSGSRYYGQDHCFMHVNCCNANGPRGFLCFLREFYRKEAGRATFNFYGSALTDEFEMYSRYPREGYVRIVSHKNGALALRLRVPACAAGYELILNGERVKTTVKKGYLTIDRQWQLGDIVELKLNFKTVAHVINNWVAFTYGPILLSRDNRFNDGDMMEPFRAYILKDGMVMSGVKPVKSPSDDIWMAFSATLPLGSLHASPEEVFEQTVFFCDYSSAANKWERGNYGRTWFPVDSGPR